MPKGEGDIRHVFNGTSCGLNTALWAPNFWLPSGFSLVECLMYNYKMIDLDFGEMFINFPLCSVLKEESGINLTSFRKQINEHFPEHIRGQNQRLIYQWSRTWMGMKLSPFWAARYYYIMEEFIVGNPTDPKNAFRWDEVILNLPGSDLFNPTLPFVIKWDRMNSRISAAIKAYVDDLRVLAANMNLAWKAVRQTAARIQCLGSQDGPRKRRVDKGSWAGTVFNTEGGSITMTVTQTKWDKAKAMILELQTEINGDKTKLLSYKRLEQIRGFFCHLALTYSILFPYLEGFHLTLSSHVPKRNDEGWKLNDLEYIAFVETQSEKQGML